MKTTALTNVQLELLKIFSREISASDLLELKKVLSEFFAKKLIESADQAWKEQGWNEEKAQELLKSHLRTPYNQ
jgi:hypothetical protein